MRWSPPSLRGARRRVHPATVAFAAMTTAGLITYLVLGRHLWFYSDEWDYVVDRHPASDPASLFRSHNGQWQTIPIIIYRILLHLTGIRTYLPYLALVVLLYLATCALAYALMLRSAVRPWIASLLAGTLVFLGFAAENVVFAAQLTYLGSIALGFVQLLLALGGMSRRRMAVTAVLGVAALMCSNLGVVTAVMVAAALLLRHGWRTAAAVTVTPAAAFVLWWSFYGSSGSTGWSATAHFLWIGLRAAGRDYSRHGDPGFVALIVVLVAGLIVVCLDRRDQLPIVAALVLGALVFLVVTGSQRATAFGAASAASARYVGVVVVLLVPVAAMAVDALWSRRRVAGAVGLIVLLVGVPGNISALSAITGRAAHITATRQLILAVPHLPAAAAVPGDLRPFPESYLAPLLTVGYLRGAARDGALPAGGHATESVLRADRFRLRLYQTNRSAAAVGCHALGGPTTVQVHAGSTLRLAGGFVSVRNLTAGAEHGLGVYYNPNRGDLLEVLSGDLTLRLSSQGLNGQAQLCQR